MGKKDDAMTQIKLIYAVDASYKDVSDKMDAFYGAQGWKKLGVFLAVSIQKVIGQTLQRSGFSFEDFQRIESALG
jgi:hypothetical protein